jgi:Tfp pilus assembly protein PilO
MTSKMNQRWLIVGTIWFVTLVMTYWNYDMIDGVAAARENSERLRREYAFQHRNADKLHQVQALYASHFKPVASAKLGFESVRSSLHALAALLGLENVKIESQMAQAAETQLPFILRMTGDYQKAMGFVSALLKYPYLSINHSRIMVLSPKADAEIEIVLDFHFEIKSQQDIAHRPLRASALPDDRGVRTQ